MVNNNLRRIINEPSILVAPGAYDMVSAKLIEQAGFKAVYMTGYGQCASGLGLPDIGLNTMTEMVERLHNMVHCVNIPIIADGDTGYGNVLNVRRTVCEYEEAGAAAIQIEDQVFPKKCGHMLGRGVTDTNQMVAKIQIAVDTRQNDDFLVIARTDARTTMGMDEAIKRGKIYQKAGADIIFIESPETEEEMRQITSSIDAPLLVNMVERGRSPVLPVKKLEEIGYRIVIYPLTTLLSAGFAVRNAVRHLIKEGSTEDIRASMMDFGEFNKMMGIDEIRATEQRYSR